MELEKITKKWLILDSVDSTNTYLLRSDAESGAVVFAREQSAGRGRGQRKWLIVPGDSLIFSGLLEFRTSVIGDRIRYLPLLTGLATLRAASRRLELSGMHDAGELAIKWPNDIYLIRKGVAGKLGGVLVESMITGDAFRVVIGVGLNYRGKPPVVTDHLVPPAVLFPDLPQPDPIEAMGSDLILEINRLLPQLVGEQPPRFLEDLRTVNYLRNRIITKGGHRFRALDFADSGELLLEDLATGQKMSLTDTSEDLRIE